MKVNFKSLLLLVVIVIGMISFVSVFTQGTRTEDVYSYSDLRESFSKDYVYSFTIDGESIIRLELLKPELDANKNPLIDENGNVVFKTITGKDGKVNFDTYTEEFAFTYEFQINEILELADNCENLVDYNIERPATAPWWQSYLPFIILGLLLVGMWIFLMKSATSIGGGKMNSFAKSRAKVVTNDKDAVKFADVAGADEEKAELEEVVEFLIS